MASTYIGDAPGEYGRYLSATSGGGLITGNPITPVYGLGAATRFKLVLLGNGTYAIQISNGINYVTADQGGGLAHGSPTDGNLQTNRVAAEAWEQFEFLAQADGTYAIKTSSGFYVAVELYGVNISTRISELAAAYNIGYTAKFELVMLPD